MLGAAWNAVMVEFMILCRRNKAISMVAILDFKRVNFDLFKDILGSIPWATVLGRMGVEQHLSIVSSKLRTGAYLRVGN